ncbi:vitamin K-dependent protein C-like isoform X2 [Photinus pyralis]|nr:vitamin K-dependent protein C-like isoform X2 [Photinus pyralis]XP_031334699.1 vitamin K-dependent protein C-like isoform X2 [Photinus pyralis]
MSDRQIRVVGGNVTKENEFPWLAGMAKNGEFHCGGTLITRKHVLTAAHCVDGINYRTISIAFGDHDRKDKERFSKIQVRKIKKVVPHKLFDRSTYNNDIAILELDHPLHFDSKIQPACLPHSAVTDYSGKWAIVAGWGKTGEKQESSTILRKAIVPIWPKKDCYNSGYGEERLSENMFCAGFEEGKIDACQGDSGGPLHVKNPNGIMDVVGIVSWGRGCGRATLPGIYTKIINYLDWILEGLNGECLCPPPPTSNQNLRRA